ncbi:MAG: hypothetical protein NAG76_00680 [Candidatus Pristimantibacillus lignocellulolyticus]|uniref:Uncharacterized protein n=1 Tax=Candidatus Pristimantibacillus lignocellulolyticus TaxID=2994561 RepID=A0A9J6ZGD5_9BACL|nr:MAG: hypothetical protein NAG76_00680 [Candidatus Pristimantibacillus lignocellulolyticus]
MYAYSKLCETDEEYALFSKFFIQYREHFSKDFILEDALIHLISYLEYSSVIMSYNTKQQLIACAQYWIIGEDDINYEANGRTVYISSAIIIPYARSTRVFICGFRDLINHIAMHQPHIRNIRFSAQVDNQYLNTLYRKFAIFINTEEGAYGVENRYEVPLLQLQSFLNRLK